MTNLHDLTPDELLREAKKWQEYIDRSRDLVGNRSREARAAAAVIRSIPDGWVDADELRKVIANIRREADPTIPAELAHAYKRCADAVESLLPEPRTMAEIEWDDEHPGLEAVYQAGTTWESVVRMLYPMKHNGDDGIVCVEKSGRVFVPYPRDLTPLPGTQINLTPTAHLDDEDDGPTVAPNEKVGTQQQALARDIFGSFPNHDREHEHVHWAKHIPEHDEDDFNPAHAYRDKDGDVWVANPLTGKWQVLDDDIGDDTLPSVYGPYTRIEKEADR